VSQRDHAQGPPSAALTLVEYGDYECPYCGKEYPIVKRLQRHFGDRLRFIFRHFPVASVHPHASVAAQAAEAASAQGQFWRMHDMLFQHQDELGDADLTYYAMQLGLEHYQFEADLSRSMFARRVQEDVASGQASGVNRTPTFFINSVRYDGGYTFEGLVAALEEAERQGPVGEPPRAGQQPPVT
jgi:protein-disulfide isomerase